MPACSKLYFSLSVWSFLLLWIEIQNIPDCRFLSLLFSARVFSLSVHEHTHARVCVTCVSITYMSMSHLLWLTRFLSVRVCAEKRCKFVGKPRCAAAFPARIASLVFTAPASPLGVIPFAVSAGGVARFCLSLNTRLLGAPSCDLQLIHRPSAQREEHVQNRGGGGSEQGENFLPVPPAPPLLVPLKMERSGCCRCCRKWPVPRSWSMRRARRARALSIA